MVINFYLGEVFGIWVDWDELKISWIYVWTGIFPHADGWVFWILRGAEEEENEYEEDDTEEEEDPYKDDNRGEEQSFKNEDREASDERD